MITNESLIQKAKEASQWRQVTDECSVGDVSGAALTSTGKVYTGLSISAACGVGFCAEHNIIAQMVNHGETHILKVAVISGDGKLMPPCGRCRELLYQIDRKNLMTEFVLGADKTVCLEELLPKRWQDLWS